MKGRDLAVVTGIVQDKARVQMGLATSIVGKTSDMKALAQRFRELSDKWDEKQAKVVSVQDKDDDA